MLHKNVTHGTTGSSPEQNGLPNATNVQRIAEIRARLDAACVDVLQRVDATRRIINARIVWAVAPTAEEYEERLRVMGVIK